MMADENIDWENKSPLTIEGNPMTFGLYVMDVYAVFQKVLDAGATSVMAIEDMFYDDLVVQVMDSFGYKWMITNHKEDVSFEEMQKRFDNMMSAQ